MMKNEKYDIITCNPPYFKVNNQIYLNNNESLSISRHEIKISLEEIFKIASAHLNTKGEFYLVHRVNRLDEIIIYAYNNKLYVKNIALVKTKDNSDPYIVLVRCVKDSLKGIKIKDNINIANLKTYQNLFKDIDY